MKDRSTLLVSVSDKPVGGSSTQSGLERKKSAKDEPKVPIIYTVRNPVSVPKKSDQPATDSAVEMIDASGAKEEGLHQGRVELSASTKLKVLR